MDLKEYQEKLSIKCDSLAQQLEDLRDKLWNLDDFTQPTNAELYKNTLFYCPITVERVEETHHLGDGRSRPIILNSSDNIAKVNLKDKLYLSESQLKILTNFILNTVKCDRVNIIKGYEL